jgi:hypothetical protein
MNLKQQYVDLYLPIVAARVGPPPIALRIGVTSNMDSMEGGVPSSTLKSETYVLLSVLPTELQERVKLALQVLIAGR